VDKDALVREYAEAMVRVADAEGELDAVGDQLFAFAKLLEQDTSVREALTDPSLPTENKRGLIADAMGARSNPVAVNLLGLLVEQGRARDIARIAETFAEVAAERRQATVAEVRSAVALDEAQRARLAEALSRSTGHAVEVKVVVDPTLVGGVVARVGDQIFDGSVRSRLADAREHLVG
jgi:F-type H+-transporting ATPase subunit delta